MALDRFSLRAIAEMDGERIATAFAEALAACERDCLQRPAVEKARRVLLEVFVTPETDQRGHAETCTVRYSIRDSIPKRESREYVMRLTPKGLQFNDLSPENPFQSTIDEEIERARRNLERARETTSTEPKAQKQGGA